MKRAFRMFGAVAAICVFCLTGAYVAASADVTMVVHATKDPTAGWWDDTLTVPQFDTSLGTLTGVTVQIQWAQIVKTVVSASGSPTGTFGYYEVYTPQLDYLMPGDGTWVTDSSPTFTNGTYDGSTSPPTLSQFHNGDYPFLGTGIHTLIEIIDSEDFSNYIGPSTVGFELSVDGSVTDTFQGGSNTITNYPTASAVITVSYTYTPA